MANFQDDSKFIVCQVYETIRVKKNYTKSLPNEALESWLNRSEQLAAILPDKPILLGKYIKSIKIGGGT